MNNEQGKSSTPKLYRIGVILLFSKNEPKYIFGLAVLGTFTYPWKSLYQGKWQSPEFQVKAKAFITKITNLSIKVSLFWSITKGNRAAFLDLKTLGLVDFVPSLMAIFFTNREPEWTNDKAKQKTKQKESKRPSCTNREVYIKKWWEQKKKVEFTRIICYL